MNIDMLFRKRSTSPGSQYNDDMHDLANLACLVPRDDDEAVDGNQGTDLGSYA